MERKARKALPVFVIIRKVSMFTIGAKAEIVWNKQSNTKVFQMIFDFFIYFLLSDNNFKPNVHDLQKKLFAQFRWEELLKFSWTLCLQVSLIFTFFRIINLDFSCKFSIISTVLLLFSISDFLVSFKCNEIEIQDMTR